MTNYIRCNTDQSRVQFNLGDRLQLSPGVYYVGGTIPSAAKILSCKSVSKSFSQSKLEHYLPSTFDSSGYNKSNNKDLFCQQYIDNMIRWYYNPSKYPFPCRDRSNLFLSIFIAESSLIQGYISWNKLYEEKTFQNLYDLGATAEITEYSFDGELPEGQNTVLTSFIADGNMDKAFDLLSVYKKDCYLSNYNLYYGTNAIICAVGKMYFDRTTEDYFFNLAPISVRLTKAILDIDPNQIHSRDSHGRTLLHIACMHANEAMIALLLKYPIDTKLKDKDNRTAADYLLQYVPFNLINSVISPNYVEVYILEQWQNDLSNELRAKVSEYTKTRPDYAINISRKLNIPLDETIYETRWNKWRHSQVDRIQRIM